MLEGTGVLEGMGVLLGTGDAVAGLGVFVGVPGVRFGVSVGLGVAEGPTVLVAGGVVIFRVGTGVEVLPGAEKT